MDLQVIENYIKNVENINLEDIETLRLPQSKSYLKIIGIPYLMENTDIPIMLDFIESIIKSNYIFNNLLFMSKPEVIKTLPKSDMAIVWMNIWNAQSGQNAKSLINRCFNVGSYIATIHSTNMNSGIS